MVHALILYLIFFLYLHFEKSIPTVEGLNALQCSRAAHGVLIIIWPSHILYNSKHTPTIDTIEHTYFYGILWISESRLKAGKRKRRSFKSILLVNYVSSYITIGLSLKRLELAANRDAGKELRLHVSSPCVGRGMCFSSTLVSHCTVHMHILLLLDYSAYLMADPPTCGVYIGTGPRARAIGLGHVSSPCVGWGTCAFQAL